MRELDLLGTFLEVYRAGSLTGAARRLGLSQPAVSERLARLEEQFGEPLFTRSRAGVSPTSAGDRLAARIGDPVDRLRGVWHAEPEASGLVRIGGASDVVASRVIPALSPLASRGIALSFTLDLAPELLARVRDGALDLSISSVRTPMRGVSYRSLVDEEFVRSARRRSSAPWIRAGSAVTRSGPSRTSRWSPTTPTCRSSGGIGAASSASGPRTPCS